MKCKKLAGDDLICLSPEYVSNRGEATEILYMDKSVKLLHKTMKSVVRGLFSDALVDRKAVKVLAGEITGRKILVPLFLNARILLVPLKMRKPLVRKDNCYGYVNYFAVEEINDENDSCRIRLSNGLTLSALGSPISVRKAYADAALVAEADCFKDGFNPRKEYASKYFYGSGENPATRSDIEELRRELWEIREALGGRQKNH